MQSNRLGCLTGTGIIATLITISAIVGVAFASGSEMFTAGALNSQNESGQTYGGVSSHAQIEECKACHAAPWERERMADRCVACHTEIAQQMIDVAKLHGAITDKNSSLACRDCHPEHRGPNASLTELGNNIFPHEALGYSLKGHRFKVAREPFVCNDCHLGDATTFASNTCEACHRQMDIVFTQAHVLSFGKECLACHDGVDRFGNDFTHSRFVFQLTGKHADVGCTHCHLDARTVVDLQSAPQDCFACHASNDAHQGRFGQDCGSCHSTEGWSPAKFDHNLSVFKLDGQHAEVACEGCHQNHVFAGTPTDCFSCHNADDEHNGQFGTDCSSCHNTSSWEGATFDHNRTNFPLTGGHAGIPCTQCHTNGQFQGVTANCAVCHGEPVFHAGAFDANCASCHSSSSWSPAAFNMSHPAIADEGGSGVNHGGTSCKTCHTVNVYQSTCAACHDGNEGGEGGGGEGGHD